MPPNPYHDSLDKHGANFLKVDNGDSLGRRRSSPSVDAKYCCARYGRKGCRAFHVLDSKSKAAGPHFEVVGSGKESPCCTWSIRYQRSSSYFQNGAQTIPFKGRIHKQGLAGCSSAVIWFDEIGSV